MKNLLLLLFIGFLKQMSAQDPLKFAVEELHHMDTTRRTTDLTNFKLSDKVVICEYGKVRMFFNQRDYINNVVNEDTLIITPRYFDEPRMMQLLITGNAMIIERSSGKKQSAIVHYSDRVGSMMYKDFELTNGVPFFGYLEAYGLMDTYDFSSMILDFDSLDNSPPKRCPYTTKDFAFPDESHDTNDKHSVKTSDYFPIKAGRYFVYDNHNSYGELDTIVCKTGFLGSDEIFYFAEQNSQSKIVSVGSTMFGDGIYYYRNDSLFVKEVDYEEDVFVTEEDDMFGRRPNDEILLLPANIVPGDSIIYESDWSTKSIVYLKRENLRIGKTEHEDCIKLKIISHSDSSVYVEYLWLQKGLGLVKWMHSGGAVEELLIAY